MNQRQRFVDLLRNFSKNLKLDQGLQAHAALVKMGLGLNLILNNYLIDMYRKCGRTSLACNVLDEIPKRIGQL